MHQPYYKDDLTRTYLLPWVRLRAAKDYYKMAALLDPYPRVRQTFNLVPSLLAQIDDYAQGDYEDLFLKLARKPAAELTGEERHFILRWLRESPRFLRVQASSRYSELAQRDEDETFTEQEIRDLQVWSNLAWIDPGTLEHDPRLAELKAKDKNFTESEKQLLLDVQLELVAKVIPKYAELARRGQAELTFSPHYHPILPLLVDVENARHAIPGIRLPQHGFAHPEDARRQVDDGIREFRRLVGLRPNGMWPSEMAVGDSVLDIAAGSGVEWLISDDEVLARSLETALTRDYEGRLHQPELLYTAYQSERAPGVSVVFRDALLSNLIGFDYHRMPTMDAVRDFMRRLRAIREQQGDREFLVTVALDGENAWDFYPREGNDFLNALYSELDAAHDIVCTTVHDFLTQHSERRHLPRLHYGSWIGASFDTWIGDPEHTTAWDLLASTRDWLEEYGRTQPAADQQQLAAAWREIMITEGSDWFWWYSRKHDSGMDEIWDNQFRLHLRNVYKILGVRQPPLLFKPILQRAPAEERRLPVRDFTPQSHDDPAWAAAGRYEVGSGFGALHKPVGYVERFLYASDQSHLHLRIDSPLTEEQLTAAGVSLWIYASGELDRPAAGPSIPAPLRASAIADLGFEPGTAIRLKGREVTVARIDAAGSPAVPVASFEAAEGLFASVPWDLLEKAGGEPMQLALVVERGGRDVEQVPPTGSLGLRVTRRGPLSETESGPPLKVLIAAAEVEPFAKSGGLADVTAALAKELRRLGQDVRLVMPRYRQVGIERYGLQPVVKELTVPLGGHRIECAVYEGRADGDVPIYFVDCPEMYDRDGLYGFGDDDARFILFSRAVLEMLEPLGFVPDVMHLNDWHVALVPNLLEKIYSDNAELGRIATVLTIHNLAFQGQFGFGSLHLAGLESWGLMRVGVPHLDDVVNFLGRGIHFSDVVNTVSERYAQEIQQPEYGEGLDELLRLNAHKLFGITNGIDTEVFDPSRDPNLRHHYSADDVAGKAVNKSALRTELGLDDSRAPLLAFISRFYEQKGVDLLEAVLPRLVDQGMQIAVLGTGDRRWEDAFRTFAIDHKGQAAAVIGFDAAVASRLYAGADMLLMPSRFEPGGLAQLIALRYGTVPIVRATGGLAETIRVYDPSSGGGLGFVFDAYDPWDLFAAVVRAAESYKHRDAWARLVQQCMREDVSWARSARRYVQLYRTAVSSRGDHRAMLPVEEVEETTARAETAGRPV